MRRILKDRHTTLIVMSVFVGALAGAANIVFRSSMLFIFDNVFVAGGHLLGVHDGGFRRLLLPLLPMAGVLLLIPLAYKFPGDIYGYTFHRFLETVNLKGSILKARAIVLKTVGAALTIGTGGSAGVEGPIATVGGTIGSVMGQFFKVSGNRLKLLVAAGSAGAIAATFNAPIAGVMFAMEIVLLGNYELTSFAAIVISSGIATVVSRAYYGANPAFAVPKYNLVSAYEIPLYMVLGLVVGVLAVLYIRVFYKVKDAFRNSRIPPLVRPVVGAFIVGSIGVLFPQVLSDGYSFIEQTLAGNVAAATIIVLVFLKILATSVTLGSGGTGGVFAPALFIGAMAGGGFGYVVHWLFPQVTASSGAYATVGLGAFLAAATHAPLTGIFLLFEMTGNYQIIVPVMMSAIIGTLLARRIDEDSIDTVELTRRGINIHAGQEVAIMGRIKVKDVMNRDVVRIREDKSLSALVNVMVQRERFYIPVVDTGDKMVGILSIQDVRPVLFEEKVKGIVKAGELATEDVITLRPEDDLNTAMENFAVKDIEEIPVVSGDDSRKVIGMLRRMDVIAAYKKEVLKREREKF
ncbi:MAG: chloride channel protein [Nitrospirota bacterium]|jgi:CIC family chloride channel protein